MNARVPTLRAIQAFEAIGRFGNVAAAARDLDVSPGAISQHISRLEQDVGVALFERKGRNLVLTAWGRIYLERIRVGFDHVRAANDVLQRARLKSSIVVSAPPSIALRWLRQHLMNWQRVSPHVNVRIIGEDAEPNLDREEVDFRISYGTARQRYTHFADMFFDWVVPVCSPAFLADHQINTPADVLNGPLIGIEWQNPYQSPPSWSDWAGQFGISQPERQCQLSFSLSAVAIDAAVHDGGFVLGQSSMIAEDLTQGRLVVACDCWLKLSEPYALAWNPASLDRPFVLEFKNFLLQAGRRQTRAGT